MNTDLLICIFVLTAQETLNLLSAFTIVNIHKYYRKVPIGKILFVRKVRMKKR